MNFTQIPNYIIDEANLNPYQFQVFSIIVRKTDGWCKVQDGISLSQFLKLVTFSKKKLVSTIKELEDMQLIEKQKRYNEETKTYSYSIYKVHKNIINVVSQRNKGSVSEKQGVVSEGNKQKKAITKETNTTTKKTNKKESPKVDPEKIQEELMQKCEIEFTINLDAFAEFTQHRKEIKKPLTELAIKKLFKKLTKYPQHIQQEMIDTSIQNGWAGVFEPKKQFSANANNPFNDAVDRYFAGNTGDAAIDAEVF